MNQSKFVLFAIIALSTQVAKAQEVTVTHDSDSQAIADIQADADAAAAELNEEEETPVVRSSSHYRGRNIPLQYNVGGAIDLGRAATSTNAAGGAAFHVDGGLLTTRTPVPYRLNLQLDSTHGAGGRATSFQVGGTAELPSELQLGVDYRHLSVSGDVNQSVNTVGATMSRSVSLLDNQLVLNGSAGLQLGGSRGDNGQHAAGGIALSGSIDFERQIAESRGLIFTINPHAEYNADAYISGGIVSFQNMQAALNFCAHRNRSSSTAQRYCAGLTASMQTYRTPDDRGRNSMIGLELSASIGGGRPRRPAAEMVVQDDVLEGVEPAPAPASVMTGPSAPAPDEVAPESNVVITDGSEGFDEAAPSQE